LRAAAKGGTPAQVIRIPDVATDDSAEGGPLGIAVPVLHGVDLGVPAARLEDLVHATRQLPARV
jgi:hypothetical protein